MQGFSFICFMYLSYVFTFSKIICGPKKGLVIGHIIMCVCEQLKHALHGYGGRAGCPWA